VISTPLGSSHLNTLRKALHLHPWAVDVALSGALFLLALATRLPFRSQMLHHWDSVNYALALNHYDVRIHQPQPPGYILYVALGAIASMIFRDPQQSYVALSVLSSGMAAVALYTLGRRMYGRTAGCLAALFLLASPSFWFYGEIAMPHTVDAAMVIMVVYLALRVREDTQKALIPLAIVLGVAGGVRQQTLLFILPLVIYCVLGVKTSRLIKALAVLAVVSLAWLIPTIRLSGGIDGYRAAVMGLGARLWQGTSVFSIARLTGLARNATRLVKYSAYSWNMMAAPLLFWVLAKQHPESERDQHDRVLALWIFPSVLFYLLVHMGNPGLVFVYLPALMLISAAVLVQLIEKKNRPRWWVASICLLTVMIAGLQFLALPEYPFGPDGGQYLNRQAIEHRDNALEEIIATIQSDFPTESTIVLATEWRHAAYYLPEYLVFGLPGVRIEGNEGQFGTVYINCGREYTALRPPTQANQFIPDSVLWVVTFDERTLRWNLNDSHWEEINKKEQPVLSYRELSEGEELEFTLEGYKIVSQKADNQPPAPPTGGTGL